MSLDDSVADGDLSPRRDVLRTVVIEGLRKQESQNPTASDLVTVELQASETDPLKDIWGQLTAQGYLSPVKIVKDGASYGPLSTKPTPLPYDKIEVVDGPSDGEHINLDETFISHANARYGQPVQFNLTEQVSNDFTRPIQAVKDQSGFRASFQRTLRMPDDNKLHQLPGSLGSFDLYNVEAYADRLPANIKEAGGVFLPMWQREAMWISFDYTGPSSRYAVRVYVGRVNAISGLLMDEDVTEKEGQNGEQDYIVLPDQAWLDGICVAPGVVRQFVAMPLGSGYTVEGQKTKQEKHGGLQIEVIPEYETNLRWWCRDEEQTNGLPDLAKELDEIRTPADHGLKVGDILRAYPRNILHYSPVLVKDLIGDSSAVWKVQYHEYFLRGPPTSYRPPSAEISYLDTS